MPEKGPERGTGWAEFFRIWSETQRTVFEAARAAPSAGATDGSAAWEQAKALSDAWMQFVESMLDVVEARSRAPGGSPFDPAGWLRSEGAGGLGDLFRWLEGPDLAPPFGSAEELKSFARGTRMWMAYATAVEQMKAVLGAAWLESFRVFIARLSAPDAAERLADWEAVVALWNASAEETLARTYRAPGFHAAMRDLVAAETDLRAELRTRVETLSDALGLPTRSELDDLHETLHGLRREVRRLRRAQAPAERA
ncbi:MAG: poly(R)-hydroxyalkanoic acid synthase subunit PhaE [Paracoccaceae bacterium]